MPIKFFITCCCSDIFFQFEDKDFSISGFNIVFKIKILEQKKEQWKVFIKELNNADSYCRVSGKYNFIKKDSQYLHFCGKNWDIDAGPLIVIKITSEIIKEFNKIEKLLDD